MSAATATSPGLAHAGTSRFDRVGAALAALAAGPLVLAGFLTTVWEDDGSTAASLATYLVDPARSQVAAVLLHFAYLLFLPVLLGLASVSHAAPRLRAAGLVATVVGAGTLPGLLITDFYALALVAELPLGQAVAVEDRAASYPGALAIFLPMIFGLALAVLLLGVAAWRSGFLPAWSAALLIVSFLGFTLARGIPLWVSVALIVALIVAFTDLARRLLRSRGHLP